MKLKPMYESKSDVPKGFEDAYEEQEGKFVLSKEIEVKTDADVQAVLDAKEHVKTELTTEKEKSKSLETKANEYVNELDVLRAKVKDGGTDEETINAIVEAKVKRATENFDTEKSELLQKLETEQGFRFKTEKTKLLSEALKGKVDDSFTSDVMDLLDNKVERGANGEWMTGENSGFDKGLGVNDLVSKFVESRPHLAPKNSGGGATGNTNTAPQGNLAKYNELKGKVDSGKATRQETNEYIQVAETVANEAKQGE